MNQTSNAPVTEKGVVDVLPDGSRMVWERGLDSALRKSFCVAAIPPRRSAGQARQRCGTVHGHGRPRGNYPLGPLRLRAHTSRRIGGHGRVGASAEKFRASASANGNGAATMDMQMPTDKISPEVSFPYGFPKAGRVSNVRSNQASRPHRNRRLRHAGDAVSSSPIRSSARVAISQVTPWVASFSRRSW